jgi:hypothetical protein
VQAVERVDGLPVTILTHDVPEPALHQARCQRIVPVASRSYRKHGEGGCARRALAAVHCVSLRPPAALPVTALSGHVMEQCAKGP